eukprot:13049627-Alexandrium_andersonii.AAC.1
MQTSFPGGEGVEPRPPACPRVEQHGQGSARPRHSQEDGEGGAGHQHLPRGLHGIGPQGALDGGPPP